MQENLSGINETRLEKLALEVIDYADKINKVFNQLQTIVDKTNSCFQSQEGDEFRKKFNSQANYFLTMNQNILSYASDFVKVKEIYHTKSTNIADNVTTSTNNSDM